MEPQVQLLNNDKERVSAGEEGGEWQYSEEEGRGATEEFMISRWILVQEIKHHLFQFPSEVQLEIESFLASCPTLACCHGPYTV